MFAAIESLFVFLLIAGGSALVNWLQKRKGDPDADPSPTSLPPKTREKLKELSKTKDSWTKTAAKWEEELRKMLEGSVPSTRDEPPPIVRHERRSPPPIQRQHPVESEGHGPMRAPKIFREARLYRGHCNHCGGHLEFPASSMEDVAPCPHCGENTVLRPFQQTPVETLSHQESLSNFEISSNAYGRASELSQRVAEHMHGSGHRLVGSTEAFKTRRQWPEVAETVAQFRNAKTVRSAVIASLILGPPRAMEPIRET